jgi:hypothetical protein
MMKIFWFTVVMFICAFFSIQSQTINGKFFIIEENDTSYMVKLQLSVQQSAVLLGNSVIRFTYDTNVVSFPQIPTENKDYTISNLNGSYYVHSVTHPSSNTVSINIALITGSGIIINDTPLYIATINFKKIKSDDINVQPVMMQFFSPGSATMWTVGTWKDESMTTSVNQNKSTPSKFELLQNYPNPFNPSTTIKYQIPQAGMVTIKVYNILGQEVATLVNEMKNSGSYEVNFNANNLASGTYVYRLQAGAFVQTKKMLLLK